MNSLSIKVGKGLRSLFRLKDEPKKVAKGFALGSFIGMLPFPGFQMLISAALASILKFNRPAAIAGVFNTNIASGAFVFAFNFWLGQKLLGFELAFELPEKINFRFAQSVLAAGYEVFLSLFLGGCISGVFAMFLAYHLSLLILKRRAK